MFLPLPTSGLRGNVRGCSRLHTVYTVLAAWSCLLACHTHCTTGMQYHTAWVALHVIASAAHVKASALQLAGSHGPISANHHSNGNIPLQGAIELHQGGQSLASIALPMSQPGCHHSQTFQTAKQYASRQVKSLHQLVHGFTELHYSCACSCYC